MRKLLVLAFALIFTINVGAQNSYSRAKVYTGLNGLNLIGSLGIPVEGEIKKGEYIISDFSMDQIALMRNAGLSVEILIPDVISHYANQNMNSSPRSIRNNSCAEIPEYSIPSNFDHGSMGGYLTYSELIAELDQMRALYPSLISAKQAISSFTTSGGRVIHYVRLSDNPDVDESEPEVMFLALTHAREPMAMQQLIFFMWYLLENYSSSIEIQNMLQNTEIYVIPCVNPDGYSYNESTNPSGGGMWRKNRRNNGSGSYGVDLNRNYGFQWGYDNVGSSPTSTDETYRGPAAFSEPETQAVKWFCEQHDFLLIQDYHTYSNVMLYPWGYVNAANQDSVLFKTYSSYMTSENGFSYGTPMQCIGYNANGGSFDWYYGEQSTKNKIIGWGPEVGDPVDGFWPAESLINDICKLYMAENLYMVRFAMKYAAVTETDPIPIPDMGDYLNFDIQRLGMDSPATFTVSLQSLSPLVNVIGAPKVYTGMSLLEIRSDSIQYELSTGIPSGTIITFVLSVDNGDYLTYDTIQKIYGNSDVTFVDPANSMTNWSSSSWGITPSSFVSSPSSITDSPSGSYSNNSSSFCNLDVPVSLSNAYQASVSFWARWDLEDGYDYVQFQVSTDGGVSWIPQCGSYTNNGSAYQDLGQPLYDGVQSDWVFETVDLTDYLGSNLSFRFYFQSDGYMTFDGFYFDDFSVSQIVATGFADHSSSPALIVYPNPSSESITVSLGKSFNGDELLEIRDAAGRVVMSKLILESDFEMDISMLNAGVYLLSIQSKKQRFPVTRLVIR